MLEAKYFRDYKHSYMILPCIGDADTSYACKLLTSGRIGEILHCSLRHVNGMTYFYYDISSRTTLESLYKGRQMSFSQVQELFEQLYEIYCRLGDNFMEELGLVLLPEYIYYDFSRKKYIGLYYPNFVEDRPYENLMDFLLEHIDGQDERLADCLYQIYERVEESGFSLRDALQILGEPEKQPVEPGEERKELDGRKEELISFGDNNVEKEKTVPLCFTEENFHSWEKEEKTPVKKKSAFHSFLMIVSVLGILGIGYVYASFELSEDEIMLLFGCGVLMGICFIVGFAGSYRGGKKKGKATKEGETFMPEIQEEHFPSEEVISLEQVISKDWDPGSTVPRKGAGEAVPLEREECGNTVFFDSAKLVEYKLYALDKKNKKHIELMQFPYTVGKMAGCVDCVLSDNSVSRIHARFEKVGDVVQMTDMNSTNGTYKNGLRLQPQETVEIEPGDEIRFGNLNYCYR